MAVRGSDSTVAGTSTGTPGTVAGTTMTRPLAGLYTVPQSLGFNGRPTRQDASGRVIVNPYSSSGDRLTLKEMAAAAGVSVEDLLKGNPSKLARSFDAAVQQMMDKYRSYDHQEARKLASADVAEGTDWLPEAELPIYVPRRTSGESSERLVDLKQTKNTEETKGSQQAKGAAQAALAQQTLQARLDKVGQVALSQVRGETVEGEDVDQRELYSEGHDHLSLYGKMVTTLYGMAGLKLNASNPWMPASILASMKGALNLGEVKPEQIIDQMKAGMVVSTRDRSRLEIATSGLKKKNGVWGVEVVTLDQSGGSKGLSQGFRPLEQLESAGYPGIATAVGPRGRDIEQRITRVPPGGAGSTKKGATDRRA